MEAYSDFAGVYDIFMDETPYDEWCDFLTEMIGTYGISCPRQASAACGRAQEPGAAEAESEEEALKSERNLVLDLGCGTGKLTEKMASRGYDMIGVDLSEDMLSVAMERRDSLGSGTLYLLQDMRELELYSTVGTVISVCDSLNYLLDKEDVLQTFRLVNNYLYPGGIFLFDFNTVYKYEQVIGDTTIAENRENCSFIWENYYHPEEQINEYDLTIFVKEQYDCGQGALEETGGTDGQDEVFRRFQETHYQRGYTVEQMTDLVQEAGMKVELVLDADTHEAVTQESERVYILAREVEKSERA